MNISRPKLKTLYASLLIGLLMLTFLPPAKTSAAGESARWDGERIIITFDPAIASAFDPPELILNKDGDIYTGQQGLKQGSAILCYYRYKLTLGSGGTSGSLVGNTDDCPGQKVGDRPAIQITITGTVPAAILNGTADALCEKINSGGIGWFLCSAGQYLMDGATKLDHWIINFLKIDTDAIFNTSGESGRAFYTAWGIFRNVSYALLLILGLVMVISQIMGLDLFDAYAIRKMLPKLVAAAIIIPLLWPLLQFVFEMSNDAADAVMELIKSPFSQIGRSTGIPDEITAGALIGGSIAGVGGVAAFFAIGGWGVFLAMLLSVFLAVASAVFILAARDVVAYALIMASPIAVICATFEPFKKVFTLWKTFLFTILLSIPAVGAVLAASKVAAKIAVIGNKDFGLLLAIIFLIAGYALFWKIFQQLDKVSGQLGNIVGSATGKAQKALSEYRGNARKTRWNEAVEGRRNIRGAGWAAGLGRRARLSSEAGLGAFGIGKTGRAKYAEAVRTMQAGVTGKMMEQDKDRAGGDDTAMKLLAQRGMTESKFLQQYAAIRVGEGATQEEAAQGARNALGLSQSSLGARAGTSAMRVAAQRSLLKSNTSYRRDAAGNEMTFDQMSKEMYGDVGSLVEDGLVTAADGAAMIKANGARADRAGVGFGTVIQNLDRVARARSADVLDTVNPETGKSYVTSMADEALSGTGPGQLIGQRHEAVRMLAPEMMRRAQEAYAADGNQPGPQFIQQIAAAAGRRDLAGQLPELNAGLYAEGLEGQEIAGRTVSQWEEYYRTQAPQDAQRVFQEYRREYGSAWQQQQGGRPGQDPGAMPTPGGAPF